MELDTSPGPLRTSAPANERNQHVLPCSARGPFRRLVVGGGSRIDYPRLRPGDISIDVGVAAVPDVYATIEETPFPNNSFQMVVFEWLPVHILTSEKAFAEAHRILKPTGVLNIITRADSPVIRLLLESVAFLNIRVNARQHPELGNYIEITAQKSAA